VGAGTEGLAEGPLLGDERTLTECNATSQFDPQRSFEKAAASKGLLRKTALEQQHRLVSSW